MKKLISLLPAVALLCAALTLPPTLPPTLKIVKKKTVLQSPKAMSLQVNKPMASAIATKALTLAPTGVTVNRVPVVIADTDGVRVLGTNQVDALKFTSPNPTQGPYVISVSTNLNTWAAIRTGTGIDPLVVYDFTYLTQAATFFSFRVDTSP